MKNRDTQSHERKLYCIEQDDSTVNENSVLFTWEDACEVLRECQKHFPECRYVLREFGLEQGNDG